MLRPLRASRSSFLTHCIQVALSIFACQTKYDITGLPAPVCSSSFLHVRGHDETGEQVYDCWLNVMQSRHYANTGKVWARIF